MRTELERGSYCHADADQAAVIQLIERKLRRIFRPTPGRIGVQHIQHMRDLEIQSAGVREAFESSGD
jgi:hypothetical protein